VESFYGARMEGEEMFTWTQLSSAVAFIKMWLQENEQENSQPDSTNLWSHWLLRN